MALLTLYFFFVFLLYNNVKAQINGSLPIISTSSPPQTTLFTTTQSFRFDIDLTITANYSTNSTLNTTNININESMIKLELISLFKSKDLNEFMINIEFIINDFYIKIKLNINTNNEYDVDIILEYVKSNEFKQNIETIMMSDNISIIDIEYRDNKEIELNWFDPLNYTVGQWLVIGGSLFILCCIIIVCSIYCCICNKKTRRKGHDPVRYDSAQYDKYEAGDGPIRGFNNRQAIQIGGTNAVQYVD